MRSINNLIAARVEIARARLIVNRRVVGSNATWGANLFPSRPLHPLVDRVVDLGCSVLAEILLTPGIFIQCRHGVGRWQPLARRSPNARGHRSTQSRRSGRRSL